MSGGRIAILIDGGFFLKRLPALVSPERCDSPGKVVARVRRACRNHVKNLTGDVDSRWHRYVHRIFFYDAVPYEGKAHHPIDNVSTDFGRSRVAQHRRAIFDILRKQRKIALRLGKVTRERDWTIAPRLTKKLLRTRHLVEPLRSLEVAPGSGMDSGMVELNLSAKDAQDLIELRELWRAIDSKSVRLGLRQKGVDMRIGLDISTLTLKGQVDTIILIAGDSDFVPAAKLARREGVEFILDPLWQQVSPDLFEHIDGLQSGIRRRGRRPIQASPAAYHPHAPPIR